MITIIWQFDMIVNRANHICNSYAKLFFALAGKPYLTKEGISRLCHMSDSILPTVKNFYDNIETSSLSQGTKFPESDRWTLQRFAPVYHKKIKVPI